MIQQLVGLVILGFTHSYDLARDINNELELNNPRLAASLAEEIHAKILGPVKAEVDKNYKPLIPKREEEPVMMSDLTARAAPARTSGSVRMPAPPRETGPREKLPEPIRIITEVQGPSPEKSMRSPFAPAPGEAKKEPMPPLQPPGTGRAEPAPPSGPRAATEEKKAEAPRPMLIHEEPDFEPAGGPKFGQGGISARPAGGMSPFERPAEATRPPLRPARVELGGDRNPFEGEKSALALGETHYGEPTAPKVKPGSPPGGMPLGPLSTRPPEQAGERLGAPEPSVIKPAPFSPPYTRRDTPPPPPLSPRPQVPPPPISKSWAEPPAPTFGREIPKSSPLPGLERTDVPRAPAPRGNLPPPPPPPPVFPKPPSPPGS